jgi:hypothetical protein
MDLKSLPGAALSWFRRFRCLTVMVLLGLILRENYPFSNFPMYSTFSRRTYFIYLSNAAGEPRRTRDLGLLSSELKKIFDRYRRKELGRFAKAGNERVPLAEAAAGRDLLHYLDGLSASRPEWKERLRDVEIRHVTIMQENDSLVLSTKVIADRR